MNDFYKGKKILITGHTGFKGSWLTIWLEKLGAKVIGFSLEKYPNDKLFNESCMSSKIIDIRGDVQDFSKMKSVFDEYKPDIVFHLAAQPLVRKSYDEPRETLSTNILGTANVLECIRLSDSVKAAVIITSDKCYKNKEWIYGYREDDELGGHDPYSCSKGCAELLVSSYNDSYFKKQEKKVASARAGNVVGGGDWSEDRLIPDCVKAILSKEDIEIRSPNSTRPWQHVLEPLNGYLILAKKIWEDERYVGAWNFGPAIESIKNVSKVADMLIKKWGEGKWVDISDATQKHETKSLSLDTSKAHFILKWQPKLSIDETLDLVVEWYKNYNKTNSYDLCKKQIEAYEKK